jgi:2-keto-4-pentenoate hydratase
MDVTGAAARLLEMRAHHRIEPDLPAQLRPGDLADAYAIQAAVVAGLLPPGERTIGYKCACTSEIAQRALRIDRPLFGRLLSNTTTASGSSLRADRFVHRVVEAELGFRVAHDVEPVVGGHTADTISASIDAVVPAIEIVDYRYVDWSVGALQVAADNAIHGWWIHGDQLTDWRAVDLAAATVEVHRNGEPVTSGSGANVLGHPLNVMAWLADELPRFGLRLRAGDLVTTGVTTDVFEAEPGDAIRATFAGVGEVALTFDDGH